MVGNINRAGPSGLPYGHTAPEPASERAHEPGNGASSSNSPQLPARPSDAPESQARDRREMLLRARPLSRQTREWVAQGMPPTAEAGAPIRLQERAATAAPQARVEERHAQEESAGSATPRAHAESRRTLQAPAGTSPPLTGAVPHANRIVQQLVEAGADLAGINSMIDNARRRHAIALPSRAVQSILLGHFPNLLAGELISGSELATAFRRAIRRAVRQQEASAPARTPPRSSARTPERSPAPRTATESSSGSNQRTLLGRLAGLMTPDQRRPSSASNASTSQRPVDRSPPRVNQVPTRPDRVAMRNRGNIDADAALRDLAQQGVDMGRLHAALGAHIMHGRALPEDLRRALGGVGIRPYNETSLSLMEHPLLNLNIALNRMLGPRPLIAQEPRPAVPMGPPSSSRRPSGTRAATLPIMPEREDHENNVSYGMRLLDLNPGVRVRTIVDAFIAEPARRPSVVAQIRELRAATNAISSQFSQLRTISKADAASEELGFKDAAHHHLDDATHCLFGEPLSLGNRGQQVIGLAANPTGTSQSYSREANKDLVFMDMKKLAQFLVGKPEHPMNREPLNAGNIAKYAFRILPDPADS
ncbi:Type III effector hopAB3 [Pseudomonas syringae pv. philadelphi]|uniref:Type III effector hopAB3 n=1 Tax=Pseudomonas syringae pv. philadelphi TaxID=251706 RepID=A0A3M3Z4Z6_9PSED|nr:E3 ubiquitin-protein ligase [Pseudomonas syringae group genomosp. 3]RMO89810.1 Type III effector hopAB3 [Pseudomonas syringae pv. philadelphi]